MSIVSQQELLSNQLLNKVNNLHVCCEGTIISHIKDNLFEVELKNKLQIDDKITLNRVICKVEQQPNFHSPYKVQDEVFIEFTDWNEQTPQNINVLGQTAHSLSNGVILHKIEKLTQENNKHVEIISRDDENVNLKAGKDLNLTIKGQVVMKNNNVNVYNELNDMKTYATQMQTTYKTIFTADLSSGTVTTIPTGTTPVVFPTLPASAEQLNTQWTNFISAINNLIQLFKPNETN